MPPRSRTRRLLEAMPTTLSFRRWVCISSSFCERICSMSMPPTVPTPHIKRLTSLYSLRKNESWSTLSDLRSDCPLTTNEMLVSLAPCAHAMTLMPLRPSAPKSFPAMPGVCFMFSPTMATVERPLSACMGNIAPVLISLANSLSSTRTASAASSSRTPTEVEFSDEA